MANPDPLLRERWQGIVATWRSSGLSVAAFCRSRDLNLSSFYRWRNILDDLAPRPTSRPSAGPLPSFVPVRVVPDAVVEVILPSGVQLRVPLAADAGQFARLVLALAGAAPC